jgi:hypothetical protein
MESKLKVTVRQRASGSIVIKDYTTSRKIAGSRPDEVKKFFPIQLILSAALGPRFTQPLTKMSTRSRKIMFLGSKARPVRMADNLTTIS